MYILNTVYYEIINTCPFVPPEIGGILGGCNGVVNEVFFDNTSNNYSTAIYIPNVKRLNKVINDWNNSDIQFYGLFHSHPVNQEILSNEDIEYITTIMKNTPVNVQKLFFPIIIPKSHIVTFAAYKNNTNIEILPEKNIILF